jgi:hypothetical protein
MSCILRTHARSRTGMEDAIRAKHNVEIDGRRISVKEAIPQDQIPPGLFVARPLGFVSSVS